MQVFVAGLLTLSGLPILFAGARPGSLSETLSEPLLHIWAIALVAGGTMIVSAAIVPKPITALYLELAASPPLAFVLFAYASGAVQVGGDRAVVATSLAAGLAAAYIARATRAWQRLRKLRTELRKHE